MSPPPPPPEASASDPDRARGAIVFDVKGEEIGRVVDAFVLENEIMSYVVALDETIASLPEVARDELHVSPKYLEKTGEEEFRMNMSLMDAVRGQAPPPGFGGA